MNELDSTGFTYKYVRSYVVRMRPRVSVLENVPDLMQDILLEDGTATNDVEWIVADFAANDFFAIPVITDRKDCSNIMHAACCICFFCVAHSCDWCFRQRLKNTLLSCVRFFSPRTTPVHITGVGFGLWCTTCCRRLRASTLQSFSRS